MAISDEALAWAKMGVPVFPCAYDKSPCTEHGHLDASTDPEKVKKMFDFAGDCLIGARMGSASKLFALDFDLYKPGASEYMQYLSDKGLLTDTQIHTTQSGGIHILYRSDKEFPNCKPHIGVEVKGEGGYIIVPPSPGYSVQQKGIAYADPALIKELLVSKKESSSSTVDSLKKQVLSGQAFHDPLTQIAARRAAQGWPVERVQQELIDLLKASVAADNNHAEHRRWSRVMSNGAAELLRIVNSGNDKYNPNRETEKARDAINEELHDTFKQASSKLFDREPEPEPKALPEPGTAWPFEGAGYFSRTERNVFDQTYVAYPLLAENETVLLAAEPKAGKTAVALRLALSVAWGEDFGTNFLVTAPAPVLYFTLEGARAVELRLRAEYDNRKENEQSTPETDYLFVVDRPHNFGEPDQRRLNCAKIMAHDIMCRQELGTPLGLIVIDTLTKAMPGKDQNTVEDTSSLFELIGMLREAGVTANIMFIHHLSKQGNVRGSTNIEAEVDVVLGLEKDKKSGIVYMNIWRARSMDEEVDYAFTFNSRFLGKTKQGHDLHAPIVNLIEPEIDSSGASAAMAVKHAKAMEAVCSLGKGKHDVSKLVAVLATDFNVDMPEGKRPNYRTKKITKQILDVLGGQDKMTFGNYIIKLGRDNYGFIINVTILVAE